MHIFHYNYNNAAIHVNSHKMGWWGLKHLGVYVHWNIIVITTKCVHFDGLYCSNCLIQVSPSSENYLQKLIANQHHINVILHIFHAMDTCKTRYISSKLQVCWLKCYNFSDIFLNNQSDAPTIQIYSVIKLHVSGIFSAHHQEVSDDCFQAQSGWNSILIVLGNGHQNLHETYQCQMYSRKRLMMSREDARNM